MTNIKKTEKNQGKVVSKQTHGGGKNNSVTKYGKSTQAKTLDQPRP